MAEFGAVMARVYGLFNRNPKSNQMMVDIAELKPDDRLLEIGCGAGAAVALAAEQIGAENVAAVDPSETFVDMVRRRVPGADVRVAGAEDLPFDDASFTVIWSIASMHHWPDRAAGLATVASKLAPGGRLLLAERLLKKPGHGITSAQLAEVKAELAELGLSNPETIERKLGRKTMAVIHATR
ncbi:class I SAM-dependent methyltransferase [Actinobacteria bacterium YIM 96077]|uniref:Methyltransferase type 11 domain-containing protein n=1 Tax=Phytoactinopolyspora halophila TaxID=1981511 RepID=A0A329QDW1_9ACTN|nr:class I SAM-dependent methyltransferase [Phytoactinopolyspora halophila]AYY13973.1 class I SAM-dependent methyltransferase [Actinobacteria bacterium YIM 96077]RAW09412.1 hypothetical protein DPM12_21420 [Phytoactinopolyspora halophila]